MNPWNDVHPESGPRPVRASELNLGSVLFKDTQRAWMGDGSSPCQVSL